MSALRQEIKNRIDIMTDEQLEAVKPLVYLLTNARDENGFSAQDAEDLKRRIANVESGNCRFIVKTIEELTAMENE